jgi:hypothetical protein
MKATARIMIVSTAMLLLVGAIAVSAQWSKKPYTEWSDKEARKLLDDSPWGQTQVVSNTSRMFNTGPGTGVSGGPPVEGSADHLNFRIRFLSAKPIRQAFSRIIQINHKDDMNDQLAAQIKAFAAGEFPDYIVIAVDVDSTETKGQLQRATSVLQTRTTAELKNNTYLVGKGGQRLFLEEFQAPKKDGLGARFIFPRVVEGKPFISEESGEIKFVSDLSGFVLNTRFKVKDMMFNGKLEY